MNEEEEEEEEPSPCNTLPPKGKLDFGSECYYTCDNCDGYGRSNPYERIRNHLKDRLFFRFFCDRCGWRFFDQRGLTHHQAIKHG